MEKKRIGEKQENVSLRELVKYATFALTIMGVLAATFTWLDERYVNKDLYQQHEKDVTELEDKTAKLIDLVEKEREKDNNEILKAVKDAKAFPLIVRRDILLSRPSLTAAEKAELDVLNMKLRELNVQPPKE